MPKTLRLISLGVRGAGKTVFLASSCTNALSKDPSIDQDYFFECDDENSRIMVEKLLGYITSNKTYPPATFKISSFNLSLKQKRQGKKQTIANLQWSDIPGEWCSLENKNFQSALLNSHGCCVFIDADALLNQNQYTHAIHQTIQQVEAITSLIKRNNLTQYPIALICTKFDLVQSNPIGLIQLEEKLKPLTEQLESGQAISKRFYSGISLRPGTQSTLQQTTNAENALFWLTSALNTIHSSDNPPSLGQILSNITAPAPVSVGPKRPLKKPKKVLPLALLGCGVLATTSGLFLAVLPKFEGAGNAPANAQNIKAFERVLEDDPTNENAIAGLIKIYSEEQQESEAISLLESLHRKNPEDLNILTSLADLYEVQNNAEKQEETLNKILALDQINLTAIYSKVRLKIAKGQPNEARDVINQAQQHVTTPAFQEMLQQISQEIPQS